MHIFALFSCTPSKSEPPLDSAIEDHSSDTAGIIDTSVISDTSDTETDETDSEQDTSDTIGDDSPLYNQAYFKSTHNSYSGEARGGIHAQLDAGFRGLEFDIHDNDFSSVGDYQLGHSSPGNEVYLEHGNPSSLLLRDWLNHIQQWSTQHEGHAPITLTLDMKDDLTDNINVQNGSMDALNEILINIFGDQLFTPQDLQNAWPSIDTLRNKIIFVLSGHEESRQLYKRDRGYNPAVAINDAGQVIEIHDSGSGTLWYWTGQLQEDGSVEWKRHGSYDSGQTPAIDLNNDGWFVEVHQSQVATTLWSRVGYLDQNYIPIFQESIQFDNGVQPTIRFNSKDSFELREIHQSQNTGLHWDWMLTLDPNTGQLSWGDHTQTNDTLHDKDRDTSSQWIEVLTAPDQNAGDDTLLYKTNQQQQRIRYPQIAFVEYQQHNSNELIDSELWFAAIGSGNQSTIANWNSTGYLTRTWGFKESDGNHLENPPNFPACDVLQVEWYTTYCEQIGCIAF